MKKPFIYLFAALVFASCEHKELCYNHSHTIDIEVVFDWTQAPEASPASMSLYLFPEAGVPIRNEFTEPAGGEIRATNGRYDALCLNHNADTGVLRAGSPLRRGPYGAGCGERAYRCGP